MIVEDLIETLKLANPKAKILVATSPFEVCEILSIYSTTEVSNINKEDKVLWFDVGV